MAAARSGEVAPWSLIWWRIGLWTGVPGAALAVFVLWFPVPWVVALARVLTGAGGLSLFIFLLVNWDGSI
jgi:hypothetical protein